MARACTGDMYQTVHRGSLIAWHTCIKTSMCNFHRTQEAFPALPNCIDVAGQAHSSHCCAEGALCFLEFPEQEQNSAFST